MVFGKLMRFKVKGINAIEIIMMLMMLIILASTAIPAFVSARNDTDALKATLDGIAGALGSASAINYAVRTISKKSQGIKVLNCTDVANALEGPLNSEYTIVPAAVEPGGKTQCTVTHRSGFTATFEAHGVS